MEKQLRKAELARLEAKRRARDAKEYAALEPLLTDPGSVALCRTLCRHWGELAPPHAIEAVTLCDGGCERV